MNALGLQPFSVLLYLALLMINATNIILIPRPGRASATHKELQVHLNPTLGCKSMLNVFGTGILSLWALSSVNESYIIGLRLVLQVAIVQLLSPVHAILQNETPRSVRRC